MLPSFYEDGLLTKPLNSVEQSIKLGQYMLFCHLLSKGNVHPNLQAKEGTKQHKYPKYLCNELPIFGHNGLYIIE